MTTPIIILILLSAPLFIGFLISKVNGLSLNLQKYALWGLGICFIFFSLGHVVKTGGMVQMLPSCVPFRLEVIYFTGVLEFMVGVALFIPKIQIYAAKVAIVILAVFFPVNVHAAFNSTGLGGHQWGPIYLLVRFPLQLILIAWAYFLCIKSPGIQLSQKDTNEL